MRQNKFSKNQLADTVCLITGGAGLLGSAFVEACANAGATVVFTDTNAVAGKKLVQRLAQSTSKQNVFFAQCDITSESEVKKCISTVLKKYKRIDALVNNAYPRNK